MKKLSLIQPFVVCVALLAACATAPSTEEKKDDLAREAETALSKAQRNEPQLEELCRQSVAYAVFPKVGKGAAGVGGAYGKGVLFEDHRIAGYCDLTQASVGLQLGGQTYTEILCFESRDALQRFKADEFALDAQATAVALDAGAGRNLDYKDGVAVVTTDEAGLMAEASIGGQKFTYEPR
jgi:lipid-binding SYLF domain-containing protein